MTEMINLSRLYNAVGSLSEMRRALIEAYQFLKYRLSFGVSAIEHPLIRTKLTELASIYTATFYLTWHAIHTLDKADSGSNEDAELLRLLTPMLKKTAAEAGVYLIRECMELMGGIGYIEDGVMPKLFRDTLVLPIWEGAGNIMVLDMLRASVKSEGLKIMLPFIQKQLAEYDFLLAELQTIQELLLQLPQMDKETTEATAKPLFERLAMLYELALLKFYQDSESSEWIEPALQYFLQKLQKSTLSLQKPLPLSEVEKMIAWVID